MLIKTAGDPTPPVQGSSRLIDVSDDASQGIPNALGTGVLGFNAPKSQQQNSVKAPWGNFSGANKDRFGALFNFLGASSFNQGAACNVIVPIVGRSPESPPVPQAALDYYGFDIWLGQGEGIIQGNALTNPPYVGIELDVGIFFFPNDLSLSFSSLGGFTNLDGQGGAAGIGLFIGDDGLWHYGLRAVRSGTPTALDVDFPLVFAPGNPQGWPTEAANADQMVRTRWEWFASRNGAPAKFRLTIGNNPPLVDTTLADIGATPIINALGSQLPDGFSQSTQTYGWTRVIRAGNGRNDGNAAGTMTLNADANPGDSSLSIAIAGPSGDFAPGDLLVVGGQHFFVTGVVLIPAAAVTVVPVSPDVSVLIPATTAVTYTAEPQTFGVKAFAHFVGGPADEGSFLV